MTPDHADRVANILANTSPGDTSQVGILAVEVRRLAAEVERVTSKREHLLSNLLHDNPRKSVAYILGALEAGCRRFTRARRPEHYALVTPSARPDCPPGRWQVTRFDDDGPMGHSYGAPMEGVARELRDHGFTVPAPEVAK